jgi:hypothetical protein
MCARVTSRAATARSSAGEDGVATGQDSHASMAVWEKPASSIFSGITDEAKWRL